MITSTVQSFLNTSSTQTGSQLDKGNTMGKDDFLELLVTQLKNQDPMNPVKNEDMAAHLLSFRALKNSPISENPLKAHRVQRKP
jgi:flagellar basal-body rod modification protein FlgD